MTQVRCSQLLLLSFLLMPACSVLPKRDTASQNLQRQQKVGDKAVDQFFQDWNRNAKLVGSMECSDASLDIKGDGQPFAFRANILYQADKNFLLRARLAGTEQAVMGSNDKEVWFYVKRNGQVYTCDREKLPFVKLAMPVHPDWIIESLGVTPLDPSAYHPSSGTSDLYALTTNVRGPDDEKLVKRLVVNRETNRLFKIELWNVTNTPKQVLALTVNKFHSDDATGALLPSDIRIDWVDPENGKSGNHLNLVMKPRSISVNDLDAQRAEMAFRRQNYPGAEVVNLGRMADGRRVNPDAEYRVNSPTERGRRGFLREPPPTIDEPVEPQLVANPQANSDNERPALSLQGFNASGQAPGVRLNGDIQQVRATTQDQ